MMEEGVPVIDLYTYTAERLGTAAGRDHGHMVSAASLGQAAFITRAVLAADGG